MKERVHDDFITACEKNDLLSIVDLFSKMMVVGYGIFTNRKHHALSVAEDMEIMEIVAKSKFSVAECLFDCSKDRYYKELFVNSFCTYIGTVGGLELFKRVISSKMSHFMREEGITVGCFQEACFYNHTDFVKFLLTSKDMPVKCDLLYNGSLALSTAISQNNNELAKYMLTSPDLKVHANPHDLFNESFSHVCNNHNIEMLKFLFEEKDFGFDINNVSYLITACASGFFDGVEYILTSPGCTIDLNSFSSPLLSAINIGDQKIVEFLLTSQDLKVHSNIYAPGGLCFKTVCLLDDLDLLEYFIFEYKVKETLDIKGIIEDFPEVKKMFKKRRLYEKMNREITGSSDINNRLKL